MNSFQAKIGWKRMRKREIKIIIPFRSVPTRYVIENSKQIAKKFKKLKKYRCGFISSDNRQEEAAKERKRKLCFRSTLSLHDALPIYKKFQKNNKKIKKYHNEFISSQNRMEIDEKERNKNYRSVPFRSYPMCNRKFQTNG